MEQKEGREGGGREGKKERSEWREGGDDRKDTLDQ